MKLQKTILFFYLLSLASAVYGLFTNRILFIYLGHILPTFFITLWYYSYVQNNLTKINIQMLIGISLSVFSDLLPFMVPTTFGLNLHIITGILFNIFLIYVIRTEDVRLYRGRDNRLGLKVLLPFIIVFLFFGKVVMPIVPETTLIFSSFYAFLEVLLMAHCFARKSSKISYLLSGFGSSLLLLKDFLYVFHYFVFEGAFPNLYILIFPLSSIAYFLIIAGIVEFHMLNYGEKSLK